MPTSLLPDRAHEAGIAAVLFDSRDAAPALVVDVDAHSKARLTTLHERSDWVITVDRHLGIGLFEQQEGEVLDQALHLTDYAPDFVDGIGDRLTVTTIQRDEVTRILERAMDELGIGRLGRDAADVLRSLMTVSGRLALRLLKDTAPRARGGRGLPRRRCTEKATSTTSSWYPSTLTPRSSGQPTAKTMRQHGAAICCSSASASDPSRSTSSRPRPGQKAQLPAKLADDIADQLQSTDRLLQSTFFSYDPPREDADLQWARLASLLHYYADRSVQHGLIAPDRRDDIHRYIDRIESSHERPDLSLRGFVVSVTGDQGFPKRVRDVPIAVITDRELGRLGFTTLVDQLALIPKAPIPASGQEESAEAEQAALPRPGNSRSRSRARPRDYSRRSPHTVRTRSPDDFARIPVTRGLPHRGPSRVDWPDRTSTSTST